MREVVTFVQTTTLVVVAVALSVFVLQNLAPIEVNFMVWSVQAPRAVGLLGCAGLGFVAGVLVMLLGQKSAATA